MLATLKMTDEQYQEKYGTMWQDQKAKDEFYALPIEEQAKRREAELIAYQESQTALAKIKTYAELDEVKKRFVNLLGDKDGRAYVESVVIAVSANEGLQKCSAKSIMVSAMRAASLKLSVDPIMKQAHLVPFGNEATLIIDYHGLVQLSVNTNYYEIAPNVFEVYEGEDVKLERFSGKITIEGKRTSNNIIGWCGYFKAKNGTERFLYWTNEECDAHGKKYSKAFDSKRSGWQTDREKMRRKTVLRNLVSRWGNFSPQVQTVLTQDEEAIDVEAYDLPDDSNIVIPERDPEAEKAHISTQQAVQELFPGVS